VPEGFNDFAPDTATASEEALNFGPFQLFRAQRILAQDGRRLRVGSRAIDILIALAERAGEVVTKRELMAFAWPHSFVEEGNLRVHIGSLRKTLGETQGGRRYIVNVTGRGYLFSVAVTRSFAPPPLIEEDLAEADTPEAQSKIFGRDATVGAITQHLARRRLVTIVGPAGVGKSTVAYAVADKAAPFFAAGAHVVDLSAIPQADGPVTALATVLGVSVPADNPLGGLVAFLAGQRMLIVLDNCEHVLDAVAAMVEAIVLRTDGVNFLATSREPILIAPESIHRLQPLDFPEPVEGLTAAAALNHSAVSLFVARAMASSDAFDFGDAEAFAVADICRRLDGLPLAIELVAARVDLFGIRGLAGELGDRLMMEAQRGRAVQPRQQSIRGALDWSYALLTPSEALMLRRFSVFRGPFVLESAAAVVASDDMNLSDVFAALASLTAKSLITTDTTGAMIRYRMLHVTRAYASQKLREGGEDKALIRVHAEHHCALLSAAEQKWETMARADWLAEYGHTIDDVRAALDWAYSDEGDAEIGAALTIAALPFGFQLSLIEEFRRRAEIALKSVTESRHPNLVAQLRLLTALASVDLNASVDDVAMEATFARATQVAAEVVQPRDKMENLLTQSIYQLEKGNLERAISIVSDLSQNARDVDDPLAILLADRVAAQVHHFAGDHRRSRMLAERVLRHPAKAIPIAYSQVSINRRLSMRLVLCRILWLEGAVDQAAELMVECMALAAADGPFAICFSLAFGACPLALWMGDLALSQVRINDLLDDGKRFANARWRRLAEGFDAYLERQGAATLGPFAALDVPLIAPASLLQREVLATVDDRHVDKTLVGRATAGLCGWCNPEMLRVSAEQLLRHGEDDAPARAEALLIRSIQEARGQGALSWELRSTTSLARLWARQSRLAQAQDRLGGVLARFSEGRGTADVRRATLLLEQLSG
jgi:predicted ATPase/DNA-binding winged helix-turn-helix (wHTH) protein